MMVRYYSQLVSLCSHFPHVVTSNLLSKNFHLAFLQWSVILPSSYSHTEYTCFLSRRTAEDALFAISNDSQVTHLVASLEAHVPTTSCFGMQSSLGRVSVFELLIYNLFSY